MNLNGRIEFPVYNGRDNIEHIFLFDAGEPLSLAGVLRVVVTIGGTVIDSDVVGPGVIWWTDTKPLRGNVNADVLSLQLGDQGLADGTYDDASIVLYDATYVNGLRVENDVRVTVST